MRPLEAGRSPPGRERPVVLLRVPFRATIRIGTVLKVILLIALIPAFLLHTLLHVRRFETEYRHEQDVNLELAYSVASEFEAHLDSAAAQAKAIGAALSSLRPFTKERAGVFLAANMSRYPALQAFHWADPGGRIVASTHPEAVGKEVMNQDYFRQALLQQDWVLSDLVPGIRTRRPLLVLAQAAFDKDKLQGAWIAVIRPGLLAPHRLGSPVKNTEWVVIDRQGVPVFAQPDPANWKGQPKDLRSDPLVAAALRGEAATGMERSPVSGEKRMVARVPIGRLGWVAGAGRNRTAVLTPLWRELVFSVSLSLAVALLSGLLANWLGRRVVRDVGVLKDGVAALDRGKVPVKPVSSGNLAELASLADAFHHMAVHRAAIEESLRLSEMHLQEFNRQLEQRVEERTREVCLQAARLRELATELARTEQRERRRLAGILHDHIQQLLVAVRMQMKLLGNENLSAQGRDTLSRSDKLVAEAVQDCRSLTVELSPPVLQSAGLEGGLQWLTQRFAGQHQFRVEVHSDPSAIPQDPDLSDFLFQAIRELLFNAMKHSGVDHARVSIQQEAGRILRVTVEDDGKGMLSMEDKNDALPSGKYGLFSIRQRLEHLGGSMEVTSTPAKGLRVTLRILLAPE